MDEGTTIRTAQATRQRDQPTSRRALLSAAVGSVAGAIVATLGQARPVAAHHAVVGLGHLNEADELTQIKNTVDGGVALWGKATGAGRGVMADTASGVAVLAIADSGTGVSGSSKTGTAVDGLSQGGIGVVGASATKQGVFAASNEHVAAWAQTAAPDRPAVFAWAYGGNAGAVGVSGLATPPGAPGGPVKTGLFGYAGQDGAAVGVRGTSPLGRGGVFKGGAAQVRLVPSTSTGHPASGQKGDLFVDSAGHLWFCRGATSWVGIA